ncbi:MAG: FISUMP domain-containing protein [Bacteroidota bacterium]
MKRIQRTTYWEVLKYCFLWLFLAGNSSLVAQPTGDRTVTDVEGNVYHTVIIGRYEWMAENLKTASYSNGTAIPNITGSISWTGTQNGAYCWYNNDIKNAKIYGALYNWHAVNTGMLCPAGWRVPSDDEWKSLEGSVDTKYGSGDPSWNKSGGRGSNAGTRLKAREGWGPGAGGSDDYGFSALPGGERCSNGRFFIAGRSGFWWSSSGSGDSGAWYRNMIYGMEDVFRNTHPLWMGFSVRCIKDSQL